MRVDLTDRLSPPSLSAIDLTVARGGRCVLADVSIAFESGAVTAIVGPSGAGKTTLVHVLNGLIPPSSGNLFARDLGSLSTNAAWARLRENVATIFQDHALIGRLSALDNVLLGLADQRHPLSPWPWPRYAREKAAQALADVGLLHRAFDRVDHFSGGEKQRIGIARALVRRPRLLFGDEPFASLDMPLARRLGDDLRRLATRDGVTVVLVLHQIALARALADRIVGLREGRVAFNGPTAMFDDNAEAHVFSAPSQPRKGTL